MHRFYINTDPINWNCKLVIPLKHIILTEPFIADGSAYVLFGLTSPTDDFIRTAAENLPLLYLENRICKYIRDVWDMLSRYADTPREACFHFDVGVHTREYCYLILKLRRGAMNVWQKV